MEPPKFTYFPSWAKPPTTRTTHVPCAECGQSRWWLCGDVCPWCIAEGVFERRNQWLNNVEWFGGPHDWKRVPEAVRNEVVFRTPRLRSWQDGQWWACCADAAEFLGYAGREELEGPWSGAWEYIVKHQTKPGFATDWAELLERMDAEGSPIAYAFRCRHCSAMAGFWDCD